MIKTYKLIILFFFICGLTFAQSGANMADIGAIRQRYLALANLKLSSQRFTYESSGCVEDGVVIFYFDGKEIVKIAESGSIGDGSWVNEYYYNNGKIFFALETITGGPAIGKVTTTQYRYYVKNGQPIRVMEGKKIIPTDSKATEMLQTAGKIYKAYTTKDFASAICD